MGAEHGVNNLRRGGRADRAICILFMIPPSFLPSTLSPLQVTKSLLAGQRWKDLEESGIMQGLSFNAKNTSHMGEYGGLGIVTHFAEYHST